MKKVFKIIIWLCISFLFINLTSAAEITTSIIDIDSSKTNLLKIFLDKNISSNSDVLSWDIKLFNDIKYTNIIKDLENNNIVNINLTTDLEKNTSYSLLSVFWAEWTIDFKINDLINWLEINWDWSTWISKVNIIDSKNIQITFVDNIIWDDIDIKILKEYWINNLKIDTDNNKVINISLLNNLESDSKYLIMIFTFTTKEWDIYNIENSIYDFTTKWDLTNTIIKDEEIIKDNEKTWNIALNSAETPDTGPETWILLLSTFLLSNFVYFRKKFKS